MLKRRDLLKGSAITTGILLTPALFRPAMGMVHGGGTMPADMGDPLDPASVARFHNLLPNALSPDFIFTGRSRGAGLRYEIGMRQVEQNLLGMAAGGGPLPPTRVWGYANNLDRAQGATYPGRTIQTYRRQGAVVRWTNDLVDDAGRPLPHLLPIDTSVHWADPGDHGMGTPYPQSGVPVVVHLHGGRTQSESDGLPGAWYTPGFAATGPAFAKRDYVYTNEYEARTIWYHDHALGITRLNVYTGLAGFFIVRDDSDTGLPDNPLGLPAVEPASRGGAAVENEFAIAIQDRTFALGGGYANLVMPTMPGEVEPGPIDALDADGNTVSISFSPAPDPSVVAEFFGDVMLCNGVAWPRAEVNPRHVRLRLLNGCDSRFLYLQFETAAQAGPSNGRFPFHQIGTDQGLLNSPAEIPFLLLAPGERADVVVDFGPWAGGQVYLRNYAPDDPFGGDTLFDLLAQDPDDGDVRQAFDAPTRDIMRFDVRNADTSRGDDLFDPAVDLRPASPIDPAALGPVAVIRKVGLFEGFDPYGRLQPLLGAETEPGFIRALTFSDPVTEVPVLNQVEEWQIYNVTADAHPIHVHLARFLVIERKPFDLADDALENVAIVQHDGKLGIGGRLRLLDIDRALVSAQAIPLPPGDEGWKDTVVAYPGQVTRIRMVFDRLGRYVWHCHILSHEDHEMMRPLLVVE